MDTYNNKLVDGSPCTQLKSVVENHLVITMQQTLHRTAGQTLFPNERVSTEYLTSAYGPKRLTQPQL